MKPDNYYRRVSDLVDRTSGSLPEPHRTPLPAGRRNRIRRMILSVMVTVAVLLSILYAGDYLLLRYRMATKRNAYATVRVDRYYAIHKKGNKTEFTFDGTEDQTCVHSIFPHLGYSPCWYAGRKTEKRINL